MAVMPTEPEHKRRILIVDGHRQVADALGLFLEHRGFFSVSIVCDILEARMEIQASGCFDLLVVDLEAPGTEAGKGLEQLMGLNRPCKTVVLTGGSTTLDHKNSFLSEAFDFFNKSLPVADLLQIVNSAIEGNKRV